MAEPNRSGGGNVAVLQELDELTKIGPRRSGSEAERRAARLIEQRLRDLGREVRTEPTRIRPAFALTHLIHAVLGIVGSVVAVYSHGIGLLMVAVATLSALGDLTGAFPGLRFFTPLRASQNVISDQDTGKPGLIVLVAHYDSPRSASIFSARLGFWPRALLGSLALITICAIGRLIGFSATWFTVIQFIPTVVLIVLSPFFADAALSAPADGSADNAAGVATALALADKELEHFDIALVFTGGSAHFALGMRDWLHRHRGELETATTAVISLDNLAGGGVRYAAEEGPVFTSRMHPSLVGEADELGGSAYTSRELSDAYLTRAAGLPSLRVGGPGDADADPAGYYDFTAALLERIDSTVGSQL